MMRCPVCGKEGLDDFQKACPQCSADLSVLLKIKELPLFFYNKAVDCYNSGDLEEGMKNAHSAISMKPDFPEAYLLLARIHLENEEPATANKYIKKAKELAGKNIDTELKEEAGALMRRLNLKIGARILTYCFMIILAVAIFFAVENIFQLKEDSVLLGKSLLDVTAKQEKILQEMALLNSAIEKERVKSVNIGDILPANIKKAKERLAILEGRKKDLLKRLSRYDRENPKYEVLAGKISRLGRDIDYYRELIAPYLSFFKREQ